MDLNLASIHTAIAEAVPDRECLVFRDRRFTWSEVAERTSRLASVLLGAELGAVTPFSDVEPWESPQDHAAILAYNGNEYLEAMLGAYKARCVPVNVNYRYKAAELTHVLADSASSTLVFHGRFAPLVEEVRAALPSLRLLLQIDDGSGEPLLTDALDYEAALADAETSLPASVVGSWSSDDLYLCYTGGTTGLPKGVMWRQGDFLVSALGIRRRSGEEYESIDEIVDAARTSKLRALAAPPFMHGAAHWNAISCWVAGGTVIIQDEPGRLDAADIWRTVERERATSLLLVGDPFARPLADELDCGTYDLSSLRHLLSGGAVFSPHLKARLLDQLPGVSIIDVLGSTESGRQGVATRRAGSADGETRFVPSATAVVLDDDRTHRIGAGDGVGWLAQTGRIPRGYLGDRERTERTFPLIDGVAHAVAGDRARVVEGGAIELLGRDSMCINTGGEKVFAEEVETAVKQHPAVYDAVVCGRPSQRWGQEVVAVVALVAKARVAPVALVAPVAAVDDTVVDLSALREHCRPLLADFKLPRAVVLVDEVVRSPSGKADYRWAEAAAQEAL